MNFILGTALILSGFALIGAGISKSIYMKILGYKGNMPTLTPKQLHILQHSLGLDQYAQGACYRNHYTVENSGEYVGDSFKDCEHLVSLGYMQCQGTSQLWGGSTTYLYTVTDEGKEAMYAENPKAPKLTRSQKRYRAYIESDTGMTFGEWIKGGY